MDMASRSDQDVEFFRAVAWCANILDHSDSVLRSPSWRQSGKTTEETLFGNTLNTRDTIQAWLTIHKRPTQGVGRVDEVRSFVSLGPGLSGHTQVCHGGIVATIMDEVMGILLAVNKDLENPTIKGATVTAYLNVTYIRPVITPQIVLVTAQLRNVDGRKHYTQASIVSSNQEVLATADALFIKLKESEESRKEEN